METPATIRRNPPRKAKLTSTEKSTVKEYGSARKPYVAQGKALMPSFVTADGNRKLKLTEEATRIETLQPGPPFPRNTEIPIVIGNGMACNPQYMESLHGKSACGRESNKFDNSTPKSSNAAGQQCSITNSVEKILTSGIVGSKIENPVCEAPSWRQFEKLASNKVSVFLRIRPAEVVRIGNGHKRKASELANRSSQQGLCPSAETRSTVGVPNVCLQCQAPDRVHLITPSMYSALHKPKEEEFNGFSRVFYPESTQIDVFDEVLAPRLADLLEGESSLVVAMGPTGAGKTHTMLGSHGDPGLVPQSLRYLFASQKSKTVSTSMKIIISMFEIYSEQGGRPEKIFDLLQDGAELILQQTKIKCLHEAVAATVEEADEVFSTGLRRRTMASTAANHQSSRSHCIFNISVCHGNASTRFKQGTLTIADLAGFEREKKTKAQGVRLTESSFINNTSMVFGQCLRALLEHQKNPKKSFQRHFQYSMLTRYLKPYMEANGRMTLIVNVSPCEKDYLDTAFVLRQVAPYSKIRVLSISSKESCEGLNDEKRNSSATESQQPTTKRRKVDGSMIKSIDVYSLAKIGKPKKDPRKKSQGRFNEVCTSRGEGADHGVNDSMEATKTIEDTLGDWKANLVTEVNHILIQAGVKNFDQISQKIVSVLDNGGYYHASEGVESRLREQLAEIMSLRTNFLKEQQHAAVLLTEVEHLKKQYKDLENHTMRLEGRNSLGANCATKQITQSNSEGQEQALRAKVLGEDMNGYFASACQKPFDAEKLVDKLRYDPEGLNDVPMEDSSARLLTVTPFKGTVCGVREEQNVVNSETDPQRSQKVCTGPSHGRAVPFCSGIEQEEGLIICEFKEDLSLDGIALPITTESQCSQSQNYLEGPGETQATCHKHFEGSVYIRQQQPQNESSQFAQVSPSLSIDLTLYKEADEEEAELAKQAVNLSPVNVGCNGPSPSLHYGEDEVQEFEKCHGNEFVVAFARVGSCNSKEDSTNQILPTSREAQCLCLGNHVIETKEKQATCHQETDYYDQQDSQIKSLEIQEASPNLHKTFDSSSGPEEVQAVLDKEIHNDLSMNRNMVAGDFTTHLGEDNQQSDKLSILGHRNDFVTLQQELVNSKTVHLASNRDSGLSEQCFNKDAKSNFQKGKLLALALMQESKEISEDDGDHVSQQVNCRSRSPSHIGILGPIGHDLEEILEVSLADLEKDLWVNDVLKGSKISELLARHCGVLDISNFPRKYTHQRANCLRYCLAVISGKMNVDGTWVPLSKEAVSDRKRRFYAVIQARTVTEAAEHARAGFQVETFSNESVRETKQVDRVGKPALFQGNKENECSSAILKSPAKLDVAFKRRRLQPLSALSLHGCQNLSADLALATVEEPKSNEASPGNSVGTLAYLLTRHHR